jgi:hypothetical protein
MLVVVAEASLQTMVNAVPPTKAVRVGVAVVAPDILDPLTTLQPPQGQPTRVEEGAAEMRMGTQRILQEVQGVQGL